MLTNRLLPLLGAAALAVPGAALADSGPGNGQGHGKTNAPGQLKKQGNAPTTHSPKAHGRGRNLVFTGTVSAIDTTANTVTVAVTSGNHAAKAFKGQTVVFDVSSARIRAADSNGNGTRNELADVKAGDKVLVHVHLAKGATATPPLAARQLVDKTRTH